MPLDDDRCRPWPASGAETGARWISQRPSLGYALRRLVLGSHARFASKVTQQLGESHRVFIHARVARAEILARLLVASQHRRMRWCPER